MTFRLPGAPAGATGYYVDIDGETPLPTRRL
jgi:hypothetical protein